MGKKTRNEIIEETVHLKEKGYVNNPSDSGGEKMWAVTRATANECSYLLAH